jgi:hypothetical protein
MRALMAPPVDIINVIPFLEASQVPQSPTYCHWEHGMVLHSLSWEHGNNLTLVVEKHFSLFFDTRKTFLKEQTKFHDLCSMTQ